jgi:hypothetical protein
VVLANPKHSSKEIMTIIGQMWQETTEKDRAKYNKLAAADKVRYEAEMKVFEKNHPEESRGKSSPDSAKPTKKTAYFVFCEENRQMVKDENPEIDGKAVTRILAEKWAELKKDYPKEAEYFQAQADDANKGFEDRVSDYHSSPGSPKKLTKAEQAKADDPENFELNTKTGRYVRKPKPKKEVSPKVKKTVTKTVVKPVVKKVETVVEEDEILSE